MSTACNEKSVLSIATQRNTAPIAQKDLADEKNVESVRHVDSYYTRARLLNPLYDGQLFEVCMVVYLGWLTFFRDVLFELDIVVQRHCRRWDQRDHAQCKVFDQSIGMQVRQRRAISCRAATPRPKSADGVKISI